MFPLRCRVHFDSSSHDPSLAISPPPVFTFSFAIRMESFFRCIRSCSPVTIDHLCRIPPEIRIKSLKVDVAPFRNEVGYHECHLPGLHARLLLVLEAVDRLRPLPPLRLCSDFTGSGRTECGVPSPLPHGAVDHRRIVEAARRGARVHRVAQHRGSVCRFAVSVESAYTEQIVDDLVACFYAIPTLRSLTLLPVDGDRASCLTDHALTRLVAGLEEAGCSMMDTIQFPRNRVRGEGLEQLVACYKRGGLTKCYNLDVSDNDIGRKGVGALSELFLLSPTVFIQTVRLGGCNIRGKEGEALVTALCSERRVVLREVDVERTRMSGRVLQVLLYAVENAMFPCLQVLSLSFLSFSSPTAIGLAMAIRAGGLSHLTRLRVRHCRLRSHLRTLCFAIRDRPLERLRELDVADNDLSPEDVQALSEVLVRDFLPSLDSLDLSANRLKDAGLSTLLNYSQCEYATALHLDNCGITDDGILLLSMFIGERGWWPALRELHLKGEVRDMGVTDRESLEGTICPPSAESI